MRQTMLGDSFLSNLLVDKMDHLAAPKTTVAIVAQGKSVTLLCIGTFYSCNGMYVTNFSSYEILKWTAH